MNQPQTFGSVPGHVTQPKKKGRGCWFYGCLTVVVLFLIVAVGGYLAVKHFIGKAVETYSTTTPIELPAVSVEKAQYDDLIKRVNDFKSAIDTGSGSNQLVLGAQDINALIAHDPEWEVARGKVYVEVRNGRVFARFNVPLDWFGYSGRYVNGEGEFGLSFKDGMLNLVPDNVLFNGQPAPAEILKQIAGERLSTASLEEAKQREFFEKLASIEIAADKIVVTRR